ncbi:MAG: hypothetical protein FWF63_05130 [Fibromonadales bacterium]|nr:hypothetical protein [Fibromonadales bacterium]
MVLRFIILATAFLLSCTEVERDNCWDEKSSNYWGKNSKSKDDSAMIACLDEDYPPDTKGGNGICVLSEDSLCVTDITRDDCEELNDWWCEYSDICAYFRSSCPSGMDKITWREFWLD